MSLSQAVRNKLAASLILSDACEEYCQDMKSAERDYRNAITLAEVTAKLAWEKAGEEYARASAPAASMYEAAITHKDFPDTGRVDAWRHFRANIAPALSLFRVAGEDADRERDISIAAAERALEAALDTGWWVFSDRREGALEKLHATATA